MSFFGLFKKRDRKYDDHGRIEVPVDEIKLSQKLESGATQSVKGEEPEVSHVLLTCSMKHENYVYDFLPLARVGAFRSKVRSINCMRCGEGLIGGEIIIKN